VNLLLNQLTLPDILLEYHHFSGDNIAITDYENNFEIHNVNIAAHSNAVKSSEDRILPPFSIDAPDGSKILIFGVCDAHGSHRGMFTCIDLYSILGLNC